MEIKLIDAVFSICKVKDYSLVDVHSPFCFTATTDEENSLVCPTSRVPSNAYVSEDGWKAMRIQGILDFSLVGILAKIADLLAKNKISIFAVSTFNTDYIFIKQEHYQHAVQILQNAGYIITL